MFLVMAIVYGKVKTHQEDVQVELARDESV
jgi:hypothetical protein